MNDFEIPDEQKKKLIARAKQLQIFSPPKTGSCRIGYDRVDNITPQNSLIVLEFEAAITTSQHNRHYLIVMERGTRCILFAYHSKAKRAGLAYFDDRNLGPPIKRDKAIYHPYDEQTDLTPLKNNVKTFLKRTLFDNLMREDLKKQYANLFLLCGSSDLSVALGIVLTELKYDLLTKVDWTPNGNRKIPDNVGIDAKTGRLFVFEPTSKLIDKLFSSDHDRLKCWSKYTNEHKKKKKAIDDKKYEHSNLHQLRYVNLPDSVHISHPHPPPPLFPPPPCSSPLSCSSSSLSSSSSSSSSSLFTSSLSSPSLLPSSPSSSSTSSLLTSSSSSMSSATSPSSSSSSSSSPPSSPSSSVSSQHRQEDEKQEHYHHHQQQTQSQSQSQTQSQSQSQSQIQSQSQTPFQSQSPFPHSQSIIQPQPQLDSPQNHPLEKTEHNSTQNSTV